MLCGYQMYESRMFHFTRMWLVCVVYNALVLLLSPCDVGAQQEENASAAIPPGNFRALTTKHEFCDARKNFWKAGEYADIFCGWKDGRRKQCKRIVANAKLLSGSNGIAKGQPYTITWQMPLEDGRKLEVCVHKGKLYLHSAGLEIDEDCSCERIK